MLHRVREFKRAIPRETRLVSQLTVRAPAPTVQDSSGSTGHAPRLPFRHANVSSTLSTRFPRSRAPCRSDVISTPLEATSPFPSPVAVAVASARSVRATTDVDDARNSSSRSSSAARGRKASHREVGRARVDSSRSLCLGTSAELSTSTRERKGWRTCPRSRSLPPASRRPSPFSPTTTTMTSCSSWRTTANRPRPRPRWSHSPRPPPLFARARFRA